METQDVIGMHTYSIDGLTKYRIDKNGEVIEKIHQFETFLNLQRALLALKNKEGCHYKGSANINRVPGSFYIGSQIYWDYIP